MTRLLVTCVNKGNRFSVHNRIFGIGGVYAGVRWKHTLEEAIAAIENNTNSYFVETKGVVADIFIDIHTIHKYLKTTADTATSDTLLALPDCPI